MKQKTPYILIAEDDHDDFFLMEEALSESEMISEVVRVENGEELMDFLNKEGNFKESRFHHLPSLILLDLNMPKMDGWEVLDKLKIHPHFQRIPVSIFTTSKNNDDVIAAYNKGVNSYIVKPVKFDELVQTITGLYHYWFNLATIPPLNE